MKNSSNGTATSLADLPMFAACTRRELQVVSRAVTEVRVAQGTILTREGTRGNEFAIVLDGVASVSVHGTIVGTLGRGDHYGETSMLDDGPRTATIVAQTDMVLAVVGRQEFTALLEASPTITRAVLGGLVRRLRDARPQERADAVA